MSNSAGTMHIRSVNGSTSTIEFSMVMPGRAPARMPMTRPSAIMPRLSGCSAYWNPVPSPRKLSITRSGSEDAEGAVEDQGDALEGAGPLGKRQVHELDERVEQDHGAHQRGGRDAGPAPGARHHHERRDEGGGGQREAESRCRDHVGEDAGHAEGEPRDGHAREDSRRRRVARPGPTLLAELQQAGHRQADQDETRPE